MISAIFKEGASAVIAYGLHRYDTGQILEITGVALPDLVEIHFAQLDDGVDKATVCIGESREGKTRVKIPDALLKSGSDLAAYIYSAAGESGETARTVFLPVQDREKPELDLPDDDVGILRVILDHLSKKADNMVLEDGYLQLLSGDEAIGQRIRLPNGNGSGREIELKNDGEVICWRYTDSNEWMTLVSLSTLKGADGITPELEIREGHLIAIYSE